ncbi:hypothetical protein [Phenylobacterium montanum]|uniref:Uncharacterized protein n=1 Tax=Phenylobacterium montanum TaxID=2823693 RepID=A0A975IU17_9CAUL|nr:hypothetical protein [Caulobacter sp. S6]QUD87059.1 hypothetical protein KCG34_18610 [Caulobacter sp. S6]
MDFKVTAIVAAAALAATLFFGWRGARPPNLIKGPRMIPHRFLMVLSAAVLLLMLVHLVNLAGIHTGGTTR